MINKYTKDNIIELAQSFNQAVEEQMKSWPTPMAEETIRASLLAQKPDMSEQEIVKSLDEMRKIEFLLLGNEDELSVLVVKDIIYDAELTKEMKLDVLGELKLAELAPYVAEAYSAIALRSGKVDEFRSCVPEGAKNEEARDALEAVAPSFAKLSL